MRALEKVRIRGDVSNGTLDYFQLKDPKFARFYFLSKIQRNFHNVPGCPGVSNCGLCTENISPFLDHHFQLIAQKVNTNHYLRKIKSLGQPPKGGILRTIDIVGFYPNITHEKALASLRRFLNATADKCGN